MIDIEGLDEVRRCGENWAVKPAEGYFHGTGLDAGPIEKRLQRNASPAGITHRAIGELAAGNAWFEEPAAIAGALMRGDDLNGIEACL
jgi:hypothetical protein